MQASDCRLVKDSVFTAVCVVKVSRRVTDEIEPARGRVLDVVGTLAPVAGVEVARTTWFEYGGWAGKSSLQTRNEQQEGLYKCH